MGEQSTDSPGCSPADVLALINANAALSFINNGAYMTVAQLLANFPAGSAYDSLYANVSDLFNNGTASGIKDVVRCRFDVANSIYRWTPQREAFNGTSATTTGTVTLSPLVTPPTVRLTATLLGNLTVTPSQTNAYVGQRFRVIMNGTLGLFTSTITGLIGSNISLLGGGVKDLEYGITGWFQAT